MLSPRRPGPGQRLWLSGSLAAIRAATAAWLGLTYRCRVASRSWPLMAMSRGVLTLWSPRWVSREWRSWRQGLAAGVALEQLPGHLAAGSSAALPFAKARAATIGRDLIAVAARTARQAGRGHLTLHLPEG